nr:hypothetical protein [Tanacetum cinerariifolium]
MTSFGYRLNPHYAIKECPSCGTLYTRNCSCSKGNGEDKILIPKLPKNYARCAKCGHPVNSPYCQGCALLREKLEEDLVTYLKYFQDTFESSDDNGIYCQQCICKSCGKGAHTGYNCPPKFPIVSNPEPCNQTMNNELPQTSLSFNTTCYSDKENLVPCVSKPNFVDESSNIFNPPPQPPIYYCEFCGSNAQYGHYCTPQAPFINPEPGYSQDFNFQGPHETFQCQLTNEDYYHEQNSCYNSNSFGSDHCQPSQYTVNHPIFNAHNDFLNSQNELSIAQNKLMEQMTQLSSMCELAYQIIQKKQEEKRIEEEQAETENSLSMGDEHLDTIPTAESDEVIKSSVEDLVPILSEFE